MKINIVLPYLGIGGGHRVAYEYANRLTIRGYDVVIYSPIIPFLYGKSLYSLDGTKAFVRGVARSVLRWKRVNWFTLSAPIVLVPFIDELFIRDADVIIAESFPTAYAVSNVPGSKGRKVYLVHHYLPDEDPTNVWLRSFHLPMHRIVVSTFTKRLLECEGVSVDATLPNGVDTKVFYPPPSDYRGSVGVLIYYAKGHRKGGADAIAIAGEIHRLRPDIPITMFGPHRTRDIPGYVRFYTHVRDDMLRRIYWSHRIFVYCSRFEGWGLPPMEAMACGCAVVTTGVGGLPEYAEHGRNAVICKSGDVSAIVSSVLRLLDDEDFCKRLGSNAAEQMKKWDWERSVENLERILINLLRG